MGDRYIPSSRGVPVFQPPPGGGGSLGYTATGQAPGRRTYGGHYRGLFGTGSAHGGYSRGQGGYGAGGGGPLDFMGAQSNQMYQGGDLYGPTAGGAMMNPFLRQLLGI